MPAMKVFAAITFFAIFVSCTIRVGGKQPEIKKEGYSRILSESSTDDIFSHIGPGDVLKITVYGEKDLTGSYQVSLDNTLMFPFIGELSVAGLNTTSLAMKIADRLRSGYLVDPQVVVFIEEFVSKRIFVLGQVKKAGNFPMRNIMSVIEAISLAGGFTDFADINNVVVTRKGNGDKEIRFVINIRSIVNGLEENFYLKPGDIIYVRERFF